MTGRLWRAAALLLLLWGLGACGQSGDPTAFVLVADESQVRQGLCGLMQSAAEEQGLQAGVTVAAEETWQGRLAAVDGAIAGGARGILCVGEAWAPVIYEAQTRHPQVLFLLLDGEPRGGESAVYETAVNTHCILFREEQAGFLAGWAAVWEGYRSLGYCAGGESGRTMRYGYGFVQGADAAAAALGLAPGAVHLRYWYAGAEEECGERLSDWYARGTELIFACDGADLPVTEGLIPVAEAAGGKVMVADWDRDLDSPAVLATAAKDYVSAIRSALLAMTGDIWSSAQAGQTVTLGAAEGGVALLGNGGRWRLEQFTRAQGPALLEQMALGSLLVDAGTNRDSLPAAALCTLEEQGGA